MQRDHSELPRRTPGVGAESDACSELSDIFSTNLGYLQRIYFIYYLVIFFIYLNDKKKVMNDR